MKNIVKLIYDNPDYKTVNQLFKSNKEIYLNNTNEDNALLVLLALFYQNNDTIFVATPNLYKAQMLYDKLSRVLDKDSISFYPQDEFLTNELLVSSIEFRLERINTIIKILKENKRIVITNLYGLLKPQFSSKRWEKSEINIKTNEEIDMNLLKTKLIEYGYKKEYTVEKIGDFSIRGGIIDIFPVNSSFPYRIDFFGDEIDQIKTFDIDTQRSIDNIDNFSIFPIVDFFYNDEELNKLESVINSKIAANNFSKETITTLKNDLEKLKNREELDRLSKYLPFITDKHYKIADLKNNSKLFFLDYHRSIEQNEILINEVKEWYEQTSDYPKMGFEILYDFNELLNKPGLKVDYLEYSYKNNFKNRFSFFGEEVITYNENLNYLFRDIRNNLGKIKQIIAFETKETLVNFQKKLDVEKISYSLEKPLKPENNNVSLIIADNVFDFVSKSFGIKLITEEALTRKHITRKRGEYISVYKRSQRLNSVNDLSPGDYVVHYDYGIGRFLEIKTMQFGNVQNDYIHIEYKNGDKLYVTLDGIDQIHKYSGSEGYKPPLSKLGGKDWSKAKERVRKQVQEIADKLINLYASREKAKGFSFADFPKMENEFANNFEYIETKDQLKAIEEVFLDMKNSTPMDRLICGDVGFGKTEIALRAAFKAVLNQKQVAYLAPTTVLSKQHYETFKNRMEEFGINVALLNRFVSPKNAKLVLSQLKDGLVDILIGTHRILSNDIVFKDLGLLIVDEEQRFGVLHKEKIKEFKINVDVLSLSATPIPRTLNMAIMGVKNMSILETAPENRYPIQTYVLERNNIILRDSIERELARNGQVFYLYNRVDNIDFIADNIKKLVPEARIDIAHGQMRKHDLEKVIDRFIEKEVDVLISTTIIETGLDIPNANTLIIHDADLLGLSQLYQIRGRVGRSNRIAYAYLMYNRQKKLTEEAEKRLQVIKEFTELGSGFKIALRDLSIRGAGDVLGQEQSGFIDTVGIEMYMQILQEEVSKARGQEKSVETTKKIKASVSKFIDKDYIEDDYIKIEMHKKISNVKTINQVKELLNEIIDRFGNYNIELEIYIYEKLFEYLAQQLEVEKIKENKARISIILSENQTNSMAAANIFKSSLDVSKDFHFSIEKNQFHIILDTTNLTNHWLYTMVDFLEKINNLKSA
ncbi:MAG: transcription-repair coupling factor [Candidatus Izemoplasmatales bacterium]